MAPLFKYREARPEPSQLRDQPPSREATASHRRSRLYLREFAKNSRIFAAFAPGANRAPQFSSLVSQLFRTLLAFDIETIDLAKHSQSGGQFFGIHASNDGKIMIFAGGIPLKREGKVVGAIGVSGGSGDQDHAVATAGAAAF